jgi:hypothetical protein
MQRQPQHLPTSPTRARTGVEHVDGTCGRPAALVRVPGHTPRTANRTPPPPTHARRHYILAVSLSSPFAIGFADLGPAGGAASAGYAVFDWFSPTAAPVALAPGGTFTIATGTGQPSAPSNAHPIRYHVAAPVLPGGWVLLGEGGKVVPLSAQRFSDLSAAAAGFSVTVAGSAGEATGVPVWVAAPGKGVAAVTCPSVAGGSAVLTCTTATGSCTCA